MFLVPTKTNTMDHMANMDRCSVPRCKKEIHKGDGPYLQFFDKYSRCCILFSISDLNLQPKEGNVVQYLSVCPVSWFRFSKLVT